MFYKEGTPDHEIKRPKGLGFKAPKRYVISTLHKRDANNYLAFEIEAQQQNPASLKLTGSKHVEFTGVCRCECQHTLLLGALK